MANCSNRVYHLHVCLTISDTSLNLVSGRHTETRFFDS